MPLIDELLTIFRGAGVGDVRTPRGSRPTWYGPVDVAPLPFTPPTPDELANLRERLRNCDLTAEVCKLLNSLGLIGCATTRRISALATQLRIPRKELLPCIQGLAKRCKPTPQPCLTVTPLPLDAPRAPTERTLPSTGQLCPAPSKFRPPLPKPIDCRYAASELRRIANALFSAVTDKRSLNPANLAAELTRAAAIACSPTLAQCAGMADDLLTIKRRLNLYLQRFPKELALGPYLDTINDALDRLKGGRSDTSAKQDQRRKEQMRDLRNAGRRIQRQTGRRR